MSQCRMVSLAALALFCLALPMHSTNALSLRLAETRGPSLSSLSSPLDSKEEESGHPDSLQQLQAQAAAVVSPFRPRPFRPLPGPWQNPHVQTILGYFLRDTPAARMDAGLSTWETGRLVAGLLGTKLVLEAPSRATNFWDARKRIETPDGDWFHADFKYANPDDPLASKRDFPTVMLLHGLQSNSYSTASVGLAQAAAASGRNVVCLNFRGCSGAPNDTLGAYHLGFTDDLKHFLNVWCDENNNDSSVATSPSSPRQPIYLMGFSLGANAVLKCLGELQESAVTEYGIQGAAVLSAPLEQAKNAHVLAQPGGVNRYVYTNNLLQSLQQVARQKWQRHCEHIPSETTTRLSRQDYERALAAETITEYDDAFIAPIYGFADCWDYYEKTSSLYFLDKIAVPTLVLNAADDPFFDNAVWPSHQHAHIQWHRTEHGGHLGYFLHQCDDDHDDNDNEGWWAASELARFLDHVQDFPTTVEE